VLHIFPALRDGPRGFNELGRVVGGCTPPPLTQRLAKLEDLGVLRRDPGPAGARCDYSLTEAGLGLERVIAAIRTWASAHLRDAWPRAFRLGSRHHGPTKRTTYSSRRRPKMPPRLELRCLISSSSAFSFSIWSSWPTTRLFSLEFSSRNRSSSWAWVSCFGVAGCLASAASG